MLRPAVLVAAFAALTGVGVAQEEQPPLAPGQEDAPPARRIDTPTPPRLICSRLPFAPAALRRPTGYELRDTPKARALRAFLDESAGEVGQARRGWILLAWSERYFEVVNPGRGPTYGHMTFRRRSGRWSWRGSGGCAPVAYDAGRGATPWRLRSPRTPIAPDATRIPIWVHPRFCHSGRDARGLVLSPLVHYGREAVTVTYFVRYPSGDQDCQGTPPTRVTLVLDEPLGNRRLRDGAPYPPRLRT